jgi:hypothetical protein
MIAGSRKLFDDDRDELHPSMGNSSVLEESLNPGRVRERSNANRV